MLTKCIIIFVFFAFCLSFSHDLDAQNLDAKEVAESDSLRNGRHIQEAVSYFERSLNLPVFVRQNRGTELRIWISSFSRGESVLSISIKDKSLSILQTRYRLVYPDISFKKRDTSNRFLSLKVVNIGSKIIDLHMNETDFVNALTSIHLSHFPSTVKFRKTSEANTDGDGMLFEILTNGKHTFLEYKCFSFTELDKELHARISELLKFIRQNSSAIIPECN